MSIKLKLKEPDGHKVYSQNIVVLTLSKIDKV